MKINTFWTIFIKILGIWLVFGSITVIPQFLSSLPLYGSNNEKNVFGVGLVIGLLLLTIGIYFFYSKTFCF